MHSDEGNGGRGWKRLLVVSGVGVPLMVGGYIVGFVYYGDPILAAALCIGGTVIANIANSRSKRQAAIVGVAMPLILFGGMLLVLEAAPVLGAVLFAAGTVIALLVMSLWRKLAPEPKQDESSPASRS